MKAKIRFNFFVIVMKKIKSRIFFIIIVMKKKLKIKKAENSSSYCFDQIQKPKTGFKLK